MLVVFVATVFQATVPTYTLSNISVYMLNILCLAILCTTYTQTYTFMSDVYVEHIMLDIHIRLCSV